MKNNLTPEEISHRQTQSRRLQTELFGLQSDHGRLARKHVDLVAEIRRLKTELSHLQKDVAEKEALERSLTREIELAEEAIAHTKKQIDML